MVTRTMRYDHPAYITPHTFDGTIGAGSGAMAKFVCWTTMVSKSVQFSNIVAGTGTSIEVFLLHRINLDPTLGTTTTTLQTLGTNTAAFYSKNVQGTYTFTQGEIVAVASGTDGTSQYAVALEMYLDPSATVSA